jgi:cytochrome c-type biogenesis protein CcmH/NrfF
MSGFPYPDTESYPYDQAHLDYLQQYNTRVFYAPVVQKSSVLPWIVAAAAAAIVAVDVTILFFYKRRRSAQ